MISSIFMSILYKFHEKSNNSEKRYQNSSKELNDIFNNFDKILYQNLILRNNQLFNQ